MTEKGYTYVHDGGMPPKMKIDYQSGEDRGIVRGGLGKPNPRKLARKQNPELDMLAIAIPNLVSISFFFLYFPCMCI